MNAARSPKARLRALLLRVHRVAGLALLALWLVQAASGVLIVFHWEIDDLSAASDASPYDPRAIGRAIEREVTARPGWRFASLWTAAAGNAHFDLTLENPAAGASETLRIGGDGRVLRRRDADGWVDTIVSLHQNLLLGERGSWLIGLSGLLLFTNILFGLKLAWPRRGTWRATLRAPLAARGRARDFAWHRAIGLCIALPIAFMGASGAVRVFEDGIAALAGIDVAPPPRAIAAGPDRIAPGTALAIAARRFPGAALTDLKPPGKDRAYTVGLRQHGEIARAYGKTVLRVASTDGAAWVQRDPSRGVDRRSVLDASFPLHTGEAAGIAGRLLVVAAGLGLLASAVSGFRSWRSRRPKR